jgi:uncharacterized membrane protein YfcA
MTQALEHLSLASALALWVPNGDYSGWQWGVALLSAFLIGVSKAGVKGMGMLAIPMMASAFGAKASTGLVLPMLMAGDVFAVWYYHRHADRPSLVRFLPYAAIGVVAGVVFGARIPDITFQRSLGAIIFVSVLALAWWDRRKRNPVESKGWFPGVLGLTAGFGTMVGNLAGPFANLYFMGLQLPKNAFIGSAAWFYLILNWFKLPFHIWAWGTVNAKGMPVFLWTLSALLVGLVVGVRLVGYIKDLHYRRFILFMTALGGILVWFR